MGGMVGKEAETGLTGKVVASNITRVRRDASFAQVSRHLEDRSGWTINAVGVRRLESCERRVTVDDLVALAVALEVSPMTLLMPVSSSGDDVVAVTGTGELSASELLAWLRGDAPLPQQRHSADMHWTLPEWFIAEQDAQRRNSMHSQMNDQQDKNLLQNDKIMLQGQVDRLTKTTARQAETIEILVKKLDELGVEVRYRKSAPGDQSNGDD